MGNAEQSHQSSLPALMLGALGVVYGDIGTSPLYALKETFSPVTGVTSAPDQVIGAVSAIIWLLTIVVSVKYVLLVLRADNKGEGGIMALLALASSAVADRPRTRSILIFVGCFGFGLFFGDAILTPAISVLSAVEGLEVLDPNLRTLVLPISLVILVGLFSIQKFGTAIVGRFFGPIILLWFLVLGLVGGFWISENPVILQAFNPVNALTFLLRSGPGVLVIAGTLVLAITGAETLYADLGHFGRPAVRTAWLTLVYPSLILNYLGQGALILANPAAIENPFFLSFPEPLLLPAIVLATMATIIASQATISGAYSGVQQVIQLGLLPRMRIIHTSDRDYGQIFVPSINTILLISILAVVLSFRSSGALASAYGASVTITMLCTTFLTFFVVRYKWGYSLTTALISTCCFGSLELVLVAACASKLLDGAWFPISVGIGILFLMLTWKKGRQLLLAKINEDDPLLTDFIPQISGGALPSVDRTAVFLVSDPSTAPQALMHNIKHNLVLHHQNLIVTVVFDTRPFVGLDERLKIESLGDGFWKVQILYGFKDTPDIPLALRGCVAKGLELELFNTSYFLSREVVVPTTKGGMAKWREEIFASMSRNAGSVVSYFNIPTNQVIELGTRINI